MSTIENMGQEYCLRWNNHNENQKEMYPLLLQSEKFVDVTLSCSGQMIKCHKLILSACSIYLEELLDSNPCAHPIIILREMNFSILKMLVEFIYSGEVNVSQSKLSELLLAAESLKIRGLCGADVLTEEDVEVIKTVLPRPRRYVLPRGTIAERRGAVKKQDKVQPKHKREVGKKVARQEEGNESTKAYKKKIIKLEDADEEAEEEEEEEEEEPKTFEENDAIPTADEDLSVPGPSGMNKDLSPGSSSDTCTGRGWPPKVRFYRQYTNDNLWAALMEVKKGSSVYGASKEHGIPRKTLRNWMKRWNIQSAYQLNLDKKKKTRPENVF